MMCSILYFNCNQISNTNYRTMKNIKQIIFSLSVVSCVFINTACSIHEQSNATGWAYNESSYDDYNKSQLTNLDGGFSSDNVRTDFKNREENLYAEVKKAPKIIYTAYLTLTVKEIDTTNSSIESIAEKYKGYVSTLGSSKSIIRVESQFLKAAITDIEALGKIDYKNISGRDVTENYMDTKIRLENAEKARIRYLELLAKAEDVKAVLLVERELERLNGLIDTCKGRLNNMDHLSQYSTITINLKKKKKPGVLGYIGIGVYKSVKWLFVRG